MWKLPFLFCTLKPPSNSCQVSIRSLCLYSFPSLVTPSMSCGLRLNSQTQCPAPYITMLGMAVLHGLYNDASNVCTLFVYKVLSHSHCLIRFLQQILEEDAQIRFLFQRPGLQSSNSPGPYAVKEKVLKIGPP